MFLNIFLFCFPRSFPHAVLWVAFTVMYILMPNTRVRFVPALIAGIICGSVWEGAFRVYTDFNIGLTKYNTIYGTFAVLPIFFIWLYISWLIVLIGAQLSYAIQNVRSYQQEIQFYNVGYARKEEMALSIMLKVSTLFHNGQPHMGVEELSGTLDVPVRLVREITQKLCDRGLLQEIFGDEITFQPSMNIELISVLDVCHALRHEDDRNWRVPENEQNNKLQAVMEARKKQEEEKLGSVKMLDLVSRSNVFEKN